MRDLLIQAFDSFVLLCWHVYGATLCRHDWRTGDCDGRTAELHTSEGVKTLHRCHICTRLKWLRAR